MAIATLTASNHPGDNIIFSGSWTGGSDCIGTFTGDFPAGSAPTLLLFVTDWLVPSNVDGTVTGATLLITHSASFPTPVTISPASVDGDGWDGDYHFPAPPTYGVNPFTNVSDTSVLLGVFQDQFPLPIVANSIFSITQSIDFGAQFANFSAGTSYTVSSFSLFITYTPTVVENWYFNPLSGHFQFSATDPGAPWVLSSVPVVDLVSVTPSKGPAAGGTPVVLKGSGFGDGATVTFGGTAATAVNVVNDNTITCTTPAHAEGVVDVTVTNADATSGTLVHGYAYIIELTLSVDTTAIFADGDATVGLTMGVDAAFASPAILDLTTPPDVILGPSVSLDTTTAMTPASAGSNAGGTDLPLVVPGPGAPTDPANPAASQHWWGLQRFDVKPRLEEHK